MVRVIGSGGSFNKGVNPQLFEESEILDEPTVGDEAVLDTSLGTGTSEELNNGAIESDTLINEDNGKINKNSTIAELIDKDPSFADTLSAQGLGCGGCPMSQFETIEQGALSHGMDPDELLKNLNSGDSEYEEYD